mmetsp:Transcript_132922/g.296383  ORF Transcript_132922/g.296383 Transcript_132922/m.296383 type:complete len:91 (+) Transcript_132922:280-552(+)
MSSVTTAAALVSQKWHRLHTLQLQLVPLAQPPPALQVAALGPAQRHPAAGAPLSPREQQRPHLRLTVYPRHSRQHQGQALCPPECPPTAR